MTRPQARRILRSVLPAALLGACVVASPPAQAGLVVPITCEAVPGDEVVLSWDRVTYELRGTCGSVRVTADEATVTMPTATRLAVEGAGNTVRSKSLGALSVSGSSNDVAAPSVKSAVVTGSHSALTVAGLVEEVRVSGEAVTLRAQQATLAVLRGTHAQVSVDRAWVVRVPGSSTTASLGRADRLAVAGDDNVVRVAAGRTTVRVTGARNRVRVHRRR